MRNDGALQARLAEVFSAQASDLLDPAAEQLPFTGGYAAEEGEVLFIEPFALPDELRFALTSPESAATLDPHREDFGAARALVAGAVRGNQVEAYFQALDRSRVVRPGWAMVVSGDTFRKLEQPALRLGDQLAAAVVGDRLVFRSLRSAGAFLDLSAHFREATTPEILAVLDHERLAVDDPQAVVDLADTWLRKRFTLLRESGVLDRYEPARISDAARSLGLELEFRDVDGQSRLLVPSTKPALKKLLRVLNEEYFRGPLSNDVFITNSKRRVT